MTSVPGRTRPTGTTSVCLVPSLSTVTFSWKPTVWSFMCPGWSARAERAQPDRRAMLIAMRMDFIVFTSALIDRHLKLHDLGRGASRQVTQLHSHRAGRGDVVVAVGRRDRRAVQQQAAGHEGGVGGHRVR